MVHKSCTWDTWKSPQNTENRETISGSTISTLLHGKINPTKDWQALSLGDVGFLLSFRVVLSTTGDMLAFGFTIPLGWFHPNLRAKRQPLRRQICPAQMAVEFDSSWHTRVHSGGGFVWLIASSFNQVKIICICILYILHTFIIHV